MHFIQLLLVLLCFEASLVINGVANITTDEATLVEIKNHIMRFHPNAFLMDSNWLNSAPVCEWVGIFCGGRHGRVVGLNMSNMGIAGSVPSAIGNLSFLSSLDLADNSFHGKLPTQLSQLRRLRSIVLRNNYLSGNIPTWLGTLPNLKILNLYMNNFTGTIPLSLFNSTKLEGLNLGFNLLRGNIPFEVGKLVNLMRLQIRETTISGIIPSSIYKMSSLQHMDLSYNRLSGTLPDNMCDFLPNLEWVSFSANELEGELPSSLGNCSSLQILSLSINKFSGIMPMTLGNLTNLIELYMGNNSMEGESTGLRGTIPHGIFKMSSLQSMDLSYNRLSGTLPDNICDFLPNLQYLSCSANELEGQLPLSLGNCSSLQLLSLSINKFSGSIPKTLGNLTNVIRLHIGSNNMEGEIPKELSNILGLELLYAGDMGLSGTIPHSIFNLSSLISLALLNNSLSGTLPYTFGFGIPNLEEIFLSGNYISGVIPCFISNASKLTIIDFTGNKFSGSIPYILGNLLNIRWLSLEANNFTSESSTQELNFISSFTNCRYLQLFSISYNPLVHGMLPASIGNFSTSLEYMGMTNCKIKGQIPRNIGNLTSLIQLRLGGNEFQGFIPTTFKGLKNLQGLYVSGNQLQGSIPYDVCHLKQLYVLELDANNLHGHIPRCFTNLTSLRFLNLSFNNLDSPIPSTFWSLHDILSVDLSSNLLSGSLPSEVANLNVLFKFDLSRNNLSGTLPSSVGGLKSLTYLSVANNRFQNQIPISFGGLISLQYLDLSSNNLTGTIPKSLEALQYLKEFNVSFNKLQGQVPTGGSFINFSAQSYMGNYALCGLLILHMPLCRTTHIKKSFSKHLLKILLPIILSVTLVALCIIIFIKRRKQMGSLPEESLINLVAWRRISRLEITQATEGFNETNLLGIGAFGSVYKGVLSDETIVAVKVFNVQMETALKSFDVESEIFRNVRHRNLVKIVSSCSDVNFKALVLEFMPRGSLDKWLYAHNYFLDIKERLNIIIDVGAALEYLHHGYSTPIVHCDLKPSNVLLDEDKVAHLSDFGISKLFEEGRSMTETITLATVGYMAPEYGSMGLISIESDVYSFGILVMETFTRTRPTDEMFGGDFTLKDWVKQSLHNRVAEIVDANLLQTGERHFTAKVNCLSSILELACNCSSDAPGERGNMTEAVATLKITRQKFLKDTTTV